MRGTPGSPQPPRNPLSPGGDTAGDAPGDRDLPRIQVLQWVADFPADWCRWIRTERLGYQAEFLLSWLWQRVSLDGVLRRGGDPWRPEELAANPRYAGAFRTMAAELVDRGVLRYTERGDPLVTVFTAFTDGRFPHTRSQTTLGDVLARFPELGAQQWAYVDRHSLVERVRLRTLGRCDYLSVSLLAGPTLHAAFPDVNRNGRYESCRELAQRARPRAHYPPGAGRPPLAWRRNYRARWVRWALTSPLSFWAEGFAFWALRRCNALGELVREDGQPWTLADFADQYRVEARRLRKVEGAIEDLTRRGALARSSAGLWCVVDHADIPAGRFPFDADVIARRRARPADYRQRGLF